MVLLTAVVVMMVFARTADSMTNSWAVEIQSGGREAADQLASKHGFINLGQVGNLKDVYHFLKPVEGHDRLKSVSGLPVQESYTRRLQAEENVIFVEQQERKRRFKKTGYNIPSDPNWSDQWSLLNTGQLNDSDVGRDLNVERAWLQGITGCGIVVAVVDDGVEYTNSDLQTNYVRDIQYDFLSRDDDAFPELYEGMRESHGTNVAGEIAMEKGNGICGVGVAYNSFITGLRLIASAQGATGVDEANALSWQGQDVVHIYSNSWGPEDDGIVVAGPGILLRRTLETSAREGRNGKGSIYTFAAGNGGFIDTCAADGYSNSIYTISVGSAASNGEQSVFDELCSAKMVVSFDSNPYRNTMHVTSTNVENTCTDDFVGTSASTPLISGVLALLLEANPDLTWRDVQYLIAYTANRNRLVGRDWVTNGGGLMVSPQFGFGAIDAEAIVSRGRHWTNVPAQMQQETVVNNAEAVTIRPGGSFNLTFTGEADIVFVEHVVVTFSLDFVGVTQTDLDNFMASYEANGLINWPERGLVQVYLTSPSGTTSTLLPRRSGDIYPNSYSEWPFMSVHFWGENPQGTWTITVIFRDIIGSIQVSIPKATIYGTSRIPEAVSRIPETCSPECDSTRGCAALGAEFCDACSNFRLSSTRQCVTSCPSGLSGRNGYCYDSSEDEASCEADAPTRASSAFTMHQALSMCSVILLIVFSLLIA